MPCIHRKLVVSAVLILAVALPSGLLAQTASLTGSVVDGQTGRPLASAQVRLLEAHREESVHADGTFLFRQVAPGTYTLVVDHLGYAQLSQSVVLRAGEARELRLSMSVAAIALDPLVVTGAVTQRSGKDVLSAVSVVSRAELERKLNITVAETLRELPGLAVSSLGPATGRPVIRGLGGDRILILEDGQRPGDLSSTSSDHAVAIESAAAHQFEVVRGPMSLLYGSSAMGGVVNVIRDEIPRSLPEHTGGSLLLQGSTVNDGVTGGADLNFAWSDFALRAEAGGRRAGDVGTPAGTLVNTGARVISLAGGAARVGDFGHAGVSYRLYRNDYGIPGGFVGGHERGVNIEMRRHTARAQLELHRDDSFLSRVSLNSGFTDYAHAELERSGGVSTRFGQTFLSSELVAHNGPKGVVANGTAGLRAQYRDITTGGSLRSPSTWDIGLAGFIVEELGTGALRFQAGARYDWARYSPRDTSAYIAVGGEFVRVKPRTFGSVSGSVGALFVVSEILRIGASVSRAYRTPDFTELYSNGPHLAANSYDVGDVDLDEETGIGFDVFLRLSHDRARAEVAAFHNQLDNYIFPSSRGRAEIGQQGMRPRFQYTNESARFVGFEGDAEVALTSKLIVDLTASYVRATFTSDRAPIPIIGDDTTFVPASQYPPLIPPLNGRAGARWQSTSFFAGAGVRWAARQDRIGDFETATPGYAVADLNAGVRLSRSGRQHAITLRIDNLFDREYRDHLSRIKEIMPQPGRDVSLSYRLTF
jgi:iron complex outermembrane receptor protein